MLFIPPPKRRQRRPEIKINPESPPPPQGPILIGADYYPDNYSVVLHFDRDFNADGFNGATLTVYDGVSHSSIYLGTDGAQVEGDDFEVWLNGAGDYSGSDCVLTVTADNGIVSATNGAPWTGCTGFVLNVL